MKVNTEANGLHKNGRITGLGTREVGALLRFWTLDERFPGLPSRFAQEFPQSQVFLAQAVILGRCASQLLRKTLEVIINHEI